MTGHLPGRNPLLVSKTSMQIALSADKAVQRHELAKGFEKIWDDLKKRIVMICI